MMNLEQVQRLSQIRHEILSTRKSPKEEELIEKLDELMLKELTTTTTTKETA